MYLHLMQLPVTMNVMTEILAKLDPADKTRKA
jgi:hypothetical protein